MDDSIFCGGWTLTEYWTGFSLPAQVEEMLRITGIVGFDE
jgi:hypothetical protein